MHRRDLMIGAAASLGLFATGCTTTTTNGNSNAANGDERREIDIASNESLSRLYANAHGSRELVSKARGTLIFPNVLAAGFGIGGEYGKGELRIGGAPVAYYSLAAASLGLQIGAQSKAVVFLFMTEPALDRFRASDGWTAGADASVAVLRQGANGDIDTNTSTNSVIGFVVTNAGLMANASVEGSKISRLSV